MTTPITSTPESHSVFGQIEIQSFSVHFNIIARRDHLGHHTPEIFHQMFLSGKNLNGHDFTKVDMRFREINHIVTNPGGSADTFIMDIPKPDFGVFDQMLKMTLDSKDSNPRKLLLEYSSSPNKYEYNASFIVR